MTSLQVLRNFTSIALTACCAIGVSTAQAQNYTLMDLGIIAGQNKDTASAPAAINDKGQIAGTSGASAFRFSSSSKKPIMEDAGRNSPQNVSRAFGINSSGLVVGDSRFGADQTSHAALFSKGSISDLGTLGEDGSFSRANGINASGQVVGFTSQKPDLAYGRAFIVGTSDSGDGASRLIDLGTLGGDYAQALAINDAGFVTGNSQAGANYGSTHAFIWDVQSGMLDLGTLAGGDFSYGTAINANNHVVGYAAINNVDDRVHAFLYKADQQMIDLGSLGGASLESDRSFALGINVNDDVVGYSYLPPSLAGETVGPPVAFIYRRELMTDLNTLIRDAAKDYRLYSATGINDKGQIVAVAYVTSVQAFHAVLLTPELAVGSGRPNTVG
ncbi:MAG: hypothetical protein QOC70_1610, partial [Verrucomicrobiota bacterium]